MNDSPCVEVPTLRLDVPAPLLMLMADFAHLTVLLGGRGTGAAGLVGAGVEAGGGGGGGLTGNLGAFGQSHSLKNLLETAAHPMTLLGAEHVAI